MSIGDPQQLDASLAVPDNVSSHCLELLLLVCFHGLCPRFNHVLRHCAKALAQEDQHLGMYCLQLLQLVTCPWAVAAEEVAVEAMGTTMAIACEVACDGCTIAWLCDCNPMQQW